MNLTKAASKAARGRFHVHLILEKKNIDKLDNPSSLHSCKVVFVSFLNHFLHTHILCWFTLLFWQFLKKKTPHELESLQH